jgi:fluoride ion exporter CrcB/FEX
MTDAVLLGRDGHGAMAAGYLALTLVAGLAAMVSGLLVGRRVAAAAEGGDRWS